MIKRFMPKTLFARALLILVLPTALVQMVSAYVFYDRHWDNVTKHMANALAGEIALLTYQLNKVPASERDAMAWIFEDTTGVQTVFEPRARIDASEEVPREFTEFRSMLRARIDLPFTVTRLEDEEQVEIKVQLADGTATFRTTIKRLESGTTMIFMLWMTGSALVFLCIAIVFLRNQVRPIRQLAEAAEDFGKGRDLLNFKPHGAQEVRRAARAFIIMRDRIVRQIRSRTEMLAGISHDLRTPLTRMKLQLAMLGDSPEIRDLQTDVTQMERMIAEYLDFARGDGGEEARRVTLSQILAAIADDYQRQGHVIPLDIRQDAELPLRAVAFGRMMHNIIDNGLRYGGTCRISTQVAAGRCEIWVEDSGPGIAEEHREHVFKPFTRLDASRNVKTGGVGLGLAIARDVARAHGGNILLGDASGGGLRVVVRLPL